MLRKFSCYYVFSIILFKKLEKKVQKYQTQRYYCQKKNKLFYSVLYLLLLVVVLLFSMFIYKRIRRKT